MFIGAKGNSLSYVILKYNSPDPIVRQPWEYMATLAAHHDDGAYNQDKLTFHNIIIQNIVNGYDAYNYVKPNNWRDNGRRYIKELQGQR